MLKRLTSEDSELLREAYQWDKGKPQWFLDMDGVFGPQTEDEFVGLADDPQNCLLAIFRPIGLRIVQHEMVGLVIITYGEEFTAHLWAKRGTPLDVLWADIEQIKQDMFAIGMRACAVWVAERNIGVQRLCGMIGFQPTGVSMYKGTYRGRVIRWRKYILLKEAMEMAA